MGRQSKRCGWIATLLLLAMATPLGGAQDLPSQPPVSVVSSGGGLSTNLIIMIIVCTGGGIIIIGALGGLFLVCSRRRGELKGDTEAPPIVKSNHVAPGKSSLPASDSGMYVVTAVLQLSGPLTAVGGPAPETLVGSSAYGLEAYHGSTSQLCNWTWGVSLSLLVISKLCFDIVKRCRPLSQSTLSDFALTSGKTLAPLLNI